MAASPVTGSRQPERSNQESALPISTCRYSTSISSIDVKPPCCACHEFFIGGLLPHWTLESRRFSRHDLEFSVVPDTWIVVCTRWSILETYRDRELV